MAIRSIIIVSACAGAAALAFGWGLTSLGPADPSVEVQEVADQAWRVEVEEVSSVENPNGDHSTLADQVD